MEKLTAIIVDDEYRIGQLISKLIHFQEVDVELLKISDNSKEALEFILENEAVICGLTPEKARNIKEFAA